MAIFNEISRELYPEQSLVTPNVSNDKDKLIYNWINESSELLAEQQLRKCPEDVTGGITLDVLQNFGQKWQVHVESSQEFAQDIDIYSFACFLSTHLDHNDSVDLNDIETRFLGIAREVVDFVPLCWSCVCLKVLQIFAYRLL